MRQTLPKALVLMFGHEGGYVNAKTDAGGPTKYGITHKTLAAYRGVKTVTAAEVKALTLTEAEAIYRANYWIQSGGDTLPVGLDYAAFDFGVNSGPYRAVVTLQKVVGAKQDGKIGPMTLSAVDAYPEGLPKLIRDYCAARMAFLRSLTSLQTGFPVNGRGWTIRVTGVDPEGKWASQPGVVGHAVAMALSPDTVVQAGQVEVIKQSDISPATSPTTSIPPDMPAAAPVIGIIIAVIVAAIVISM